MPRIQFGVPPAMSTHSGPSSNPSSNRGDCQECVRKRRDGHRNAREPKYCPRHQCKYTDSHSGEMCTIRKKAAEARCPTHTQCKVRGCHDPRAIDATGILNEYCDNHTCVAVDCDEGRAHDPTRGVYDDLCATHLSKVCKIPACIERQFENGNYCKQHTCDVKECDQNNLSESGRPFCNEHNKCTSLGCQKPRCQFGRQFEAFCRDHYIPPCLVESCNEKSSPTTRYCNLHSCRYTDSKRCEKDARPGRGKPFCVDHKCSDHNCQTLRSFSEVEGSLIMNVFCPQHECKEATCVKHNVPDKPYCNSHCCTKQSCLSARDHDTRCGTLCYTHHKEQVENRAVEERLAELRLQEEVANDRAEEVRRQEEAANARAKEVRHQARRREEEAANARAEEMRRQARKREEDAANARAEELRRQAQRREEETANTRAEEIRRQARRREEELRDRERRERRQHTADTGRRPEARRPARSPPHHYGRQEGLRPRQEQVFDSEYEDEGYRSHRSSGGSFVVDDGW